MRSGSTISSAALRATVYDSSAPPVAITSEMLVADTTRFIIIGQGQAEKLQERVRLTRRVAFALPRAVRSSAGVEERGSIQRGRSVSI